MTLHDGHPITISPRASELDAEPPSSRRVHVELASRLDKLEHADREILAALELMRAERASHALAKLAAALLVVGGALASLAEQASRLLAAVGP